MLVELSSIPPAPSGEEDAVPDGLVSARVASGPGFWTDWLAEPDRQGLLEDLLADGVIARALREAPTGHRYDRVLTAKMTAICVLVAWLFPSDGYDAVLAKAFRLPGLRFSPGTGVPAGTAGTAPPPRKTRSAACPARSSPCLVTGPDASAHQAEPQPSAAPGTPRKSPTPSIHKVESPEMGVLTEA